MDADKPDYVDHARCGYCLGRMQGYAAITTDSGTVYLCHPDEGQDCYRLVTVYHKPIADGRVWDSLRWVER